MGMSRTRGYRALRLLEDQGLVRSDDDGLGPTFEGRMMAGLPD
jgi:hypothetical protein